jgi:DNA-binding LytR/AlgR family response regulator
LKFVKNIVPMRIPEIAIGGRKKLVPSDVILFEAEINYTRLHLSNGQYVMVATTLKKLEKSFSPFRFIYRTHKGFMVNLNFVQSLESNEVTLKNNRKVLVSRRRRELLLKNMGEMNFKV